MEENIIKISHIQLNFWSIDENRFRKINVINDCTVAMSSFACRSVLLIFSSHLPGHIICRTSYTERLHYRINKMELRKTSNYWTEIIRSMLWLSLINRDAKTIVWPHSSTVELMIYDLLMILPKRAYYFDECSTSSRALFG